jgi:hypothetical protein
MTSMIIWILGIGASIAALAVTAATKQFYLHMALAAAVSLTIALASVAEARAAETSAPPGADRGIAISLRHMGLVWAWGALGLMVTYGTDILSWREWWQFFIAFVLLAGLSQLLAMTLRKDMSSGDADPTLIKLARGFAVFVLVAMLITMIGLLIDGKMWRFTTVAGLRRGSQDWAANNIFFFGALALSVISAHVVKLTGRRRIEAI